MLRGSCQCGAATFIAETPTRDAVACHCSQCRKQSGHHWASVPVDDDKLKISGELRWYQSSAEAKRGFCPVCGAFLFWKSSADAHTSVALGSLDGETGLTLQCHIYTADKGDYYTISDGVRQEEQ